MVDGRTFLLQPRDRLWGVIPGTVGAEGCRYFLTIEAHWNVNCGKVQFAVDMIRWALHHGWSPQSGPNRKVLLDEHGVRWQEAKAVGKSN